MPFPRLFLLQLTAGTSGQTCPPTSKNVIVVTAISGNIMAAFSGKLSASEQEQCASLLSLFWIEIPVKDGAFELIFLTISAKHENHQIFAN